VTARKHATSSAKKDAAKPKPQAKKARNPLADTIAKEVAETKRRARTGQAARETSAQLRRGVRPPAAGRKNAGAARKGRAA
jgi:hypothetical protein